MEFCLLIKRRDGARLFTDGGQLTRRGPLRGNKKARFGAGNGVALIFQRAQCLQSGGEADIVLRRQRAHRRQTAVRCQRTGMNGLLDLFCDLAVTTVLTLLFPDNIGHLFHPISR